MTLAGEGDGPPARRRLPVRRGGGPPGAGFIRAVAGIGTSSGRCGTVGRDRGRGGAPAARALANSTDLFQAEGTMRSERLAAGIIILAAVGVWQVRAGQRTGARAEGGQDTAGLIEHGEYLVKAAAMCGDCHTPQDDRGGPDRARRLRG